MNQNDLYVNWEGGPEYIDLNDLTTRIKENNGKPDFEFFTYDVRPDGEICNYLPLLLFCNLDDNGQINGFSLKYETQGTYTNGKKGDGALGTAEYRLENNQWRCNWRFASEEEGISPHCELLDANTERMVRLAKQTLRNPKFRKMILEVDYNKCVITGECQREALDAAHIHEVRLNGNDTIGNGITLRKDLHALFDAGLFVITPEGRFEPKNGISAEYAKLLEGKILLEGTLRRISSALVKRNRLEKT